MSTPGWLRTLLSKLQAAVLHTASQKPSPCQEACNTDGPRKTKGWGQARVKASERRGFGYVSGIAAQMLHT